jgi:hypothetical protein
LGLQLVEVWGPVSRIRDARIHFNTRTALFPLMINWPALGPVMVRFLSIATWLASVIVQGQPLRLKLIVSPAAASAIAWRSEQRRYHWCSSP